MSKSLSVSQMYPKNQNVQLTNLLVIKHTNHLLYII